MWDNIAGWIDLSTSYRKLGAGVLTFAFCLSLGCTPLIRRADPVRLQAVAGTQKNAIEPVPLRTQTIKVAVRVTPRQVEARLADPLRCVRSGSAEYAGLQATHYRLATTDSVLRWSAFGVAGAVAGLVAVGLARGRNAGRGAAIRGIDLVYSSGGRNRRR